MRTRSAMSPVLSTALEVGGEYAYRVRGETHSWTPETVSLLQHAVRGNARDRYDAFAKLLNEQSAQLLTIRGLFRIKTAEETAARRFRSTRLSPPLRSSSAFRPGRCRTVRSRARRTPRSPSQ